ncbi:hypothetical protein ABZ618_00260 [Streptomyces roseolus]|uniref:hypothetical protein n=1 Tax=Streptomyces roseolus TaxID=67358 RepID=UPI00340348FD
MGSVAEKASQAAPCERTAGCAVQALLEADFEPGATRHHTGSATAVTVFVLLVLLFLPGTFTSGDVRLFVACIGLLVLCDVVPVFAGQGTAGPSRDASGTQ